MTLYQALAVTTARVLCRCGLSTPTDFAKFLEIDEEDARARLDAAADARLVHRMQLPSGAVYYEASGGGTILDW